MQKNDVYNKLQTRGKIQDEIILKVVQSTTATITLTKGQTIGAGELLVSADGGKTFKIAFKQELSDTATYITNDEVVYEGFIYKALKDDIGIEDIEDNTAWLEQGEYVINGAAMITFERTAVDNDESFKAAVLTIGELLYVNITNTNESSRVAAFPLILLK